MRLVTTKDRATTMARRDEVLLPEWSRSAFADLREQRWESNRRMRVGRCSILTLAISCAPDATVVVLRPLAKPRPFTACLALKLDGQVRCSRVRANRNFYFVGWYSSMERDELDSVSRLSPSVRLRSTLDPPMCGSSSHCALLGNISPLRIISASQLQTPGSDQPRLALSVISDTSSRC